MRQWLTFVLASIKIKYDLQCLLIAIFCTLIRPKILNLQYHWQSAAVDFNSQSCSIAGWRHKWSGSRLRLISFLSKAWPGSETFFLIFKSIPCIRQILIALRKRVAVPFSFCTSPTIVSPVVLFALLWSLPWDQVTRAKTRTGLDSKLRVGGSRLFILGVNWLLFPIFFYISLNFCPPSLSVENPKRLETVHISNVISSY